MARPGHSLPELMVTVTLLGVTLGGVAASSIVGARRATDAVRRQEAARLAESVLDSLVMAPATADGARRDGSWRIRWTVGPGAVIEVAVESAVDGLVVALSGRAIPNVPPLPDPPPGPVVP